MRTGTKHATHSNLKMIFLASLASILVLGCPELPESTEEQEQEQEQEYEAAAEKPAWTGLPQGDCDPKTTVFDWAMCLCNDLDQKGNGFTARPLSEKTRPLNIGINDDAMIMGNMIVDGTLDIADKLLDFGNTEVYGDLMVGDDALIAGRMIVEQNAMFGEALLGAGVLEVDGGLSVLDPMLFTGHLKYNQKPSPTYKPHKPCPCGRDEIIHVKDVVAQHRDDTPLVLASGAGNQVVTISPGDYYTDDAWLFAGNTQIEIDGHVRLFVEDDILLIGNGKISLLPGAELDLYISGSLGEIGNFHFGEAYEEGHPEAARVYIGGLKPITLIGNESFVGGIYAPRSTVLVAGNLRVVGAVFARNFVAAGNIKLVYNSELVDKACDDQYGDADGVFYGGHFYQALR